MHSGLNYYGTGILEMFKFALDWVGPKGLVGNGNPLNTALYPELYGNGIGRIPPPPFSIYQWNLHSMVGGRNVPISELLRGTEKFFYEMETLGNIEQAIGDSANPYHRSIFQNVSTEAKDAVRAGRCAIIINASNEGHFVNRTRAFHEIHRQIELERFSPNSVIFFSSNLKVEQTYIDWANQNNLPEHRRIIVKALNLFEDMMSIDVGRNRNFVRAEDAACATKTKHFLCLNRRGHEHRQIVVSQMLAMGLADTSLVSFSSPDDGMHSRINYRDWPDFPDLQNQVAQLNSQCPMILDTNDFQSNHASTHIIQPYIDSVFSIVTETLFRDCRNENTFFSEKIYKPIANFQPFLMTNFPGSLAMMREHGYRTFAPFVDESYDAEENDSKRMYLLVEEIRRLGNIPLEELQEWYVSIFPDLVHNHTNLINRTFSRDQIKNVLASFLRS